MTVTRRDDGRAWAALGATLRQWISPRAVANCLGTSAITAVPLLDREPPAACPPAAAPIWLWCAGRAIAVDPVRTALGVSWDWAIATGLVTVHNGMAHPAIRLAPIGSGLAVCDRSDFLDQDRVPWPDDSTMHLWHCRPAAVRSWLDVGTANAVLPLAAGVRAERTRATDIAPRALAHAATGLALAGRADVELAHADLLTDAGSGWSVVTFNAPIPARHAGSAIASTWHRTSAERDLLAEFWDRVPALMTAGSQVVVHSAIDDSAADHQRRRGHGTTTIARYTPRDRPQFAVIRWRPDGDGWFEGDVALGPGRPYVTRTDLDAIETGDPPARPANMR